MMYLTAPTVLKVRPGTLARDERFDFQLANAEAAHGVGRRSHQWRLPPRGECSLDIETHSAAALRMSLAGQDCMPRILFDCRSGHLIAGPAPSYKLAARAGLHRTPPVLLYGQGGAEPLLAMRFFAGMCPSSAGAMTMAYADIGLGEDTFFSDDIVVSACLMSCQPFFGRQIRVHDMVLAHDASEPWAAVAIVVTAAIDLSRKISPQWCVPPHGFDDIDFHHCRGLAALSAMSASAPDAMREEDALQVLARLAGKVQPSDGAGLLTFMSSTGSVGALVVSVVDTTEVSA